MILASESPRRRELLGMITENFTVIPATINEDIPKGTAPSDAVIKLARLKASKVFASHRGEMIIAADTIVTFKDHILGKPRGREEAIAMLRALSGKIHSVYTGVCVAFENGEERSFAEVTHVEFYPLTEEEIEDYVATGEPMDKAGAYGIQGRGALLVKKIYGDYYNVMGLPVARLNRMLQGKK